MANARMDKMESTSSDGTYTDPIDFKKIKVTSSIYVKFGIQ
jgi:hypothetical protein